MFRTNIRAVGLALAFASSVAACVFACGPCAAHGADSSRIEGVWRFQKEIDTLADGTLLDVPKIEYEGLLIYRADGFMSATIMPKGRKWSVGTATSDELRQSVGQGTGYAGRYEMDESKHTVTHIVSASVDPSDEGRRLVREYAFEGPTLTLSGDWVHQGRPARFKVFWERIE